jgi:hypothetical protein
VHEKHNPKGMRVCVCVQACHALLLLLLLLRGSNRAA